MIQHVDVHKYYKINVPQKFVQQFHIITYICIYNLPNGAAYVPSAKVTKHLLLSLPELGIMCCIILTVSVATWLYI